MANKSNWTGTPQSLRSSGCGLYQAAPEQTQGGSREKPETGCQHIQFDIRLTHLQFRLKRVPTYSPVYLYANFGSLLRVQLIWAYKRNSWFLWHFVVIQRLPWNLGTTHREHCAASYWKSNEHISENACVTLQDVNSSQSDGGHYKSYPQTSTKTMCGNRLWQSAGHVGRDGEMSLKCLEMHTDLCGLARPASSFKLEIHEKLCAIQHASERQVCLFSIKSVSSFFPTRYHKRNNLEGVFKWESTQNRRQENYTDDRSSADLWASV